MSNQNDPTIKSNSEPTDVLAELDVLSKKYGLSFDSKKYSSSSFSSLKPASETSTHFEPKKNAPARTPRVVQTQGTAVPSIKVIYDDGSSIGKEGRRVIYSETEPVSPAIKRRMALEESKNTPKISSATDDFVSTPYSKRVASNKNSADTMFKRIYESDIQKEKHSDIKPDSSGIKVSELHYKESASKRFFGSFIPLKGDSAKEVLRKIVMDISVIAILCCFGVFVKNYIDHQNQLKNINNLQSSVENTTSDVESLEEQWAAVKKKYPNINFPDGMNIRFAELYAANQDLVGWIHIDNTNIDAAVVHKPSDKDSDNDFYLRRNFYKKDNKYGCLFLDKYNTGNTLDRNNTIYGHNMMDGLSFAQLEKYYTVSGYKESPFIEYSTLFGDYKFKVFAAFVTNGLSTGDNGYLFNYPTVFFESDEKFESFIDNIKQRSLFSTGVDVNKDDKLLILSTCSYEIEQNQMGRLAVVARLVRDGESETVDTSKATKNENPRYPQIWYDEHNMKNPYYDAEKWVQTWGN